MKIYLIENDSNEFENFKLIFKKKSEEGSKEYSILKNNHEYNCDYEGASLDQTDYYEKIITDFRNNDEEFDVLLIDLYLYVSEGESGYNTTENQLTSIRVINELLNELVKKKKRFYFVTGVYNNYIEFKKFDGMKDDWIVLSKPFPDSDGDYLNCIYEGEKWKKEGKCKYKKSECNVANCFFKNIEFQEFIK